MGNKTINQQKNENQKSVEEALKQTTETYTRSETVTRIKKSLREIAAFSRVSEEQAIDAFWFDRLKLFKEEVYGGYKSLGEFAEKSLGLTESKAVKQFRSNLAYRAAVGAKLLGKETAPNKPAEKSALQKVATAIETNSKELSIKDLEALVQRLETLIAARHAGPIGSPASGKTDEVKPVVAQEKKEAVAA